MRPQTHLRSSKPRPLSFSLARLSSAAAVAAALLAGIGGGAQAANLYWDPLGDGNGAIGGSGTWDLLPASTFWDATGLDAAVDNIVWSNLATDTAVFGNIGGTAPFNVTVAAITTGGVQFDAAGYRLAGGTLTMGGGTVTTNASGRIDSVITGAGGLIKNGLETLILGGANTFTGQLQINSGTVALSGLGAGPVTGGVGNETVVASGATLNLGGQAYGNIAPAGPFEIFRIAGTGDGGVGALINQGASQTNTTSKVVLTADATVSAGGDISTSYNAGGQLITSAGGRFDVRVNAAPTAGQNHLDLGGFTLTKKGTNLLALVNASVSDGNIVVDEGQLNFEVGTLVQGTGTITVNSGGKLGFWAIAAAGNISRQIVVNGGTIGDPTSTNAAQTIGALIQVTGALNPNFTAIATAAGVRTTLSGQITQSSFTGTEFAKRGAGILAFSNTANTFSAPITIYAGTLGADFTTTLSGLGPVPTSDTPLGTNATITLAGGTLNIRANMEDNNTQQYFDLQRSIVLDRAPSGMSFDRIGNATQTDKHVRITSLTMQPAAVGNGWSIGQNQLTFTQGNTHRLDIPLMTMNSDSVVTTGDHTFSGDILSANRNSLVRTGNNTTQFVTPGTQEFNAYFNTSGNLRVGTGFGTPASSTTVTVGTGTIYIAPGSLATWRNPTNIAATNLIEVVSQRVGHGVVNFELFNSVPTNLRAVSSGVLGVGNATAFGNIDLNQLGDGTWRIGSAFTGSGNGTITGTIAAGAGRLVRLGAGNAAGSLVTVSATNAISGMVGLEVGSPLINGGQTTSGSGTVLLSGANDYMAGTTVNRNATLRFRDLSLGSGPVTVAGTIQAESAADAGPHGTFIGAGAVTLLGGSRINFTNDAITSAATPDRWGNAVALDLVNSTLEMRSRNIPTVASDTIETVGATTFAGGNIVSLQRLQAIANHNVQLTVDTLTRVGQGTLELARSTGTGAGYAGGQKLIVTAGAPAVANGMVAPYYVAQNNGPTDFLTYGANGFGIITYDSIVTAPYVAGSINYNGTTGGKVAVTTAALTLTDDPILYALKSEQTINVSGANDTITLRTGGLNLRNVADNTTVTINPALIANDGIGNTELLVNTVGGGTNRAYQINGQITAVNLTKFGTGPLSLFASQTALTGTKSINAGILQLFGTATTNATHNPAGVGLVQLNGGQLNVRTANAAGTTFSTSNNGSYVMQSGLSVAANIPIATLDVNRSGADTTSTGTFTFNPAVAGSTGLQLLGSPGAQGQTLTVSGANYGLQFGTNAANSFTGNVTINNAVTLTLNNAPAITAANSTITKAGGGNWIVGSVAGNVAVPAGTKVVVNGGTLELRSLSSLGLSANTSLELNAGTLNLRRDNTGGNYGTATGPGIGYAVTVNGTTTISADRVSAGADQNLGLGKLTTNTNGTLTINGGNGFYPSFLGAQLNGTAFIAANVGAGNQDSAARFTNGSDVSGGALVKSGGGHLHLLNANSTYDGGTYAQAGTLRLRNDQAAGTGSIYLNPGATIDFNSSSNLSVTQPMFVRSNGAHLPMISVNVDGVSHPTSLVDTTAAPVGIVGLSNGTAGSYSTAINLSTLYGGGWSLGGVSAGAYDPVYTSNTLTAGNNNLYRLGGGGTSFAMGIDPARSALNNVLTGANDVRLGFDSGNILVVNGGNFQFSIAGRSDYSGGETTIHRGMVARLFSNNNGTQSGFSNSAVDVFGVLSLSGLASLDNGTGGQTNGVTLHPGSALFFDNQNGAANGAGDLAGANVLNRWNDTTPIALNGAMLNLIGANLAVSSETVGDVTYSRGARLRAQLTGAGGTATLSLNNLFGAGPGNTIMLATSAAGTLAGADKIIVLNTPPASINGMVTPSIVNQSDNSFVTHGVNGFQNVAYDKTLNATFVPGTLLATDKVDVITAALTLSENPVVYALRTSQTINVGGPFNSITLRSGGLIGTGGTINPHLVFNDGAGNIEARIFTTNTLALNGVVTANGITKFGSGNLTVNVPQTHASGWTVNSGTLQINDLEGLGQSVPGNGVTLNGALSTGGQAGQAFGQTTLNFNRDMGTPEQMVFTGGPITVFNEATIRMGSVSNDRNILIPAITLNSTDADSRVSLTLDVPFQRVRHGTTSLTLNSDAIIRVTDAGSTVDTGRVVAAYTNALIGTGKNLTKIGNRTLELPNDNSATFIGSTITVSQGTLRVRNNGSLGDATSTTTIERNATLELDTANFTPLATVNQLPGSIERWNQDGVRGAAYNLPSGVNLQLNTNLLAPRTIGLNGGTIEAFLWTDHPATGVERTIGSAVTVNLLSNSSVGQNILQGQGYDAGRLPAIGQPFGDSANSAYLRIDGPISGAFDLTKTGNDTVTLASTGNTYNNTTVELGVLRIGATNALPIAGVLTTRTGGTFDLYGFDQSVVGLGTLDSGPNPGGVGVGSAGRVINSGVTDNTLTVTGAANYTYNGSLGLNAALTKTGAGTLTLAGNNTHRGLTTVTGGTLVLNATGFNTIEGDQVKDKVADILINGGTLRWDASNQVGDSVAINMTSGALDINGKTETLYDLTNSGGTFTTGVGGITNIPDPTLSGGTTTLNADSVNTWGVLNISGGVNTVQGQNGPAAGTVAGAVLRVGAIGGTNFSGTASPNLTINADAISGGMVVLEGNVTSTVTAGQASITNSGAGADKGTLDLNAANRTVSVADGSDTVDLLISADIVGGVGAALTKTGAGRLALDGAQNYLLLTTNAGKTDVNGAFTGGTAIVDANATTNFTVSQTLAALNIADGVVVTLGNPPPAAPAGAFVGGDDAGDLAFGGDLGGGAPIQGVPEPGTAMLLLGGLATMLGLSRRRPQ